MRKWGHCQKTKVCLASSLKGKRCDFDPISSPGSTMNHGSSLLVSSGMGSMPSSCDLEPVPGMT